MTAIIVFTAIFIAFPIAICLMIDHARNKSDKSDNYEERKALYQRYQASLARETHEKSKPTPEPTTSTSSKERAPLTPQDIQRQKDICKKYGFDYVEGETMPPDMLERVLRNEREYLDGIERRKKAQLVEMMKKTVGTGGVIDGLAFERFCADMLTANGYDCELTKSSGDHGADIIATKSGISYAVQCKYYDNPVGNKAVQEALAGMVYYRTNRAVVLTNSTFTQQAVGDAQRLGVELWDCDRLTELMQAA